MKPIHILLIADGRSPITRRWITILNEINVKVSLVSTYRVQVSLPVDEFYYLPVAFSRFIEPKETKETAKTTPVDNKSNWKTGLIRRFRSLFLNLRYSLGPLTLRSTGRKLRKIISQVQPDLVHALRVPFEGMVSQYTPLEFPLITSIWGNDLTLHADRSKSMRKHTTQTMRRINGLMADVQRDIHLAKQWSYDADKPALVVPGAGGIDLNLINKARQPVLDQYHLPWDCPLIINPRGIRAYTQTDVFFSSIPMVLQRFPNAHFICTGMKGEKQAEDWVNRLKIHKNVTLLPAIPQNDLWAIFHKTRISISITEHDGTPNTLLEAMACGSYPIAGDIESIREWITPGINGLLVELNKPQALADAVIRVLNNPQMVPAAAEENKNRIHKKGDVKWVQQQVEQFYRQFLPEPEEPTT